MINSATGPIGIDDIGVTLSHEHLFINMMRERRGDGLLHDERLIAEELSVFADQGGATVLDLTTAELTPGSTLQSDPPTAGTYTRTPENVSAVQRVSRSTGVQVILGTGRYRDPYLDRDLIDRLGVRGLTAEIVRDVREGFPATDVKAGVIGEIGSDKWFVSATEERCFRAAARAAVATGLPVYTHAARWAVAMEQIDLLLSEGMDPAKIAVGHLDTVPVDGYAVEVARRGVFVGIDTINSSAPHQVEHRVRQVTSLVRAGFIDRILLSHDVCTMSQLRAAGGNGFGFVLGGFRDALMAAGLDVEEFNLIVRANPERLLA